MMITALLYFAVPLRFRWIVLLLSGYAFMIVCSSYMALAHLAVSLASYLTGKKIADNRKKLDTYLGNDEISLGKEERKKLKDKGRNTCRQLAALGIFISLAVLFLICYFDSVVLGSLLVIRLIPVLAKAMPPQLGLLVPVGISIYTLMAIGYIVDVYRGKASAEENFFKFLAYMSFFPQLVNGPVPDYSRLYPQLMAGRRFSYLRMCRGLQLILWGFFKKLVIADRIVRPALEMIDDPVLYRGLMALMGAACYGIMLYADLSGAVDVARGFSQVLGIRLEENFSQPFLASSLWDFWRRWIKSLSSWMGDYVLLPLSKHIATSMKRRGKPPSDFYMKRVIPAISVFVIFVLIGIWHGPGSGCLAFGLWNALIVVFSLAMKEKYARILKRLGINPESLGWRIFSIARTFFICCIGWIFLAAKDAAGAIEVITAIFRDISDASFLTEGVLLELGLNNANWLLLIPALILLAAVDLAHERGIRIRAGIEKQALPFRWSVYITGIIVVFIFGVYGPTA